MPTAKSQPGFTLVELMVSMAIFAVISGFVLVNFRGGSRQDEVRTAGLTVAAVIRDGLSRAAAGATVPVCLVEASAIGVCGRESVCPGSCLDAVPKRWGIALGTLTPDSVALFADVNDNSLFENSETVYKQKLSPSGLVTAVSASPVPGQTLIFFSPPLPSVSVSGDAGEASLSIRHQAGGRQLTVRFNRVSRRIDFTSP